MYYVLSRKHKYCVYIRALNAQVTLRFFLQNSESTPWQESGGKKSPYLMNFWLDILKLFLFVWKIIRLSNRDSKWVRFLILSPITYSLANWRSKGETSQQWCGMKTDWPAGLSVLWSAHWIPAGSHSLVVYPRDR